VDVAKSALKHGVVAQDAALAAERFLVARRLGDDPVRELRLGFDSEARLLETVVIVASAGAETVIHAMRARASYFDWLPGKEKR
jgi:hypothetical protein